MLVTKELNLSTIKYYGATDLSTNWFINEFLKNQNFILQSVSNYQDYNALDNIQHYHFLLSLAKDNQQKINYQEQINLWQNKTKVLQLTLVPILVKIL